MQIERMTSAHLADAAELERACFHAPWSEQSLALLTSEAAVGFAAMEDGVAVAYGGMLIAPFEGQITNIATSPHFRRRGAGALVLCALLEEARARGLEAVVLEVRESNAGAIALYEKQGFAVVGRRPRFYKNPSETALIMQKDLKAGNE